MRSLRTSARARAAVAVLLAALLAPLAGCRNLRAEEGPPPARITGEAHYLERIALPPGAVLVVRLVEPATPGARGAAVAESVLVGPPGPPFAFELGYDPRRLAPGRVHRLEAELSVDGEVWFRGARSVPELAAGPPPEPLELRLVRASR